jgi:predicted ATP-grasp superfamily ATP-dependent carboligase
MQSPSLVLVFAQSGRFIAESATRAGYTVRVADCFGDSDTLAVADRWLPLPPLSELSAEQLLSTLVTLSDNQPCWLVCGTGIERFYPALSELPAHIRFAGNPAESFAVLRQPTPFFHLLSSLQLPYPEVSYHPQQSPFLLKDMAASGGFSIQRKASETLSSTQYYQQYIEGGSFSVCFVADGKRAHILGWNRQSHSPNDFLLSTIYQPAAPPAAPQAIIFAAVNKLTQLLGLRGFNSLDYLVDNKGQVFILELNPRITASAELVPDINVISIHLAACTGPLTEAILESTQPSFRMLHYLFADRTVSISVTPHWPEHCHDLPHPGSSIEAGQPICTLIAEAESATDCHQQLEKNITAASQNCHSDA